VDKGINKILKSQNTHLKKEIKGHKGQSHKTHVKYAINNHQKKVKTSMKTKSVLKKLLGSKDSKKMPSPLNEKAKTHHHKPMTKAIRKLVKQEKKHKAKAVGYKLEAKEIRNSAAKRLIAMVKRVGNTIKAGLKKVKRANVSA
jgi:hypothetical protein